MMNIVDSVTTIGCRRRKAMKKPLNAPVNMPMPMPTAVQSSTLASMSIGSMDRASTTFTNEMTAPAERSKPPDKMTSVCPIAASAEVAPPLDRKVISK